MAFNEEAARAAGVSEEDIEAILASQQQPSQPVEESSYFDKVVLDSAISTAQGFVGLGQAVVGLFDIPTLGYAGKGLEYALDNVFGGDLADLTQWLQSFKTDEQLLAERELSEVKGFLPTIKELATNPGALSNSILRTLPQMLGGWAIGKKLLTEVGKYGAKKGLGVKATQELIKKNAVKATGAGEGIIATGAMAEDIRQQSEDGLITPTQAALSVGSGVLTGILGTLGGQVRLAKGLKKQKQEVLLWRQLKVEF
jgi:hypothetical protein